MGDVYHYLELRAQGRTKEHRFRKSWKAVLYMLEDAAAIPSHNQPCEFSGEPRATFLMDFSPSKLRVASTHGDHTVRVSDVRTGKCTHILTGHPRTPWCLAFSPTSDDILASGCLAGEIRIWDLMGGGSEVLRNPRRGQVVTSLAFHPSGQVLAFSTMNFIYFWDWSKETPFAFTQTSHESERIRWLKFDPYGHYLYTGIGNLTSFHRDIIGAEMELGDGLDDNAHTEERRNQQTLSRARYQRLLERFMSFRREHHRYRNESFLHYRDEYNLSNNSTRAGQWTQAETDDQSSLSQNILNQSFPSQALASESVSWDNNRYGRRNLDSDRLGELPSRQRWGRYEPSFFSRSNDSSSASSTVSNGRSYNFSNDNDYKSGFSDNATSRMNIDVSHDGQSSGPYSGTSLFPTGFGESAGAPSALSHLSRNENVAASDGLDTDEFKILPVDQGRESTYNSARRRSMSSESLECNCSDHRPGFLQQRDELQALLNRYINRSSEGSSASSGASTLTSLAPLQTTQSFISSAASTADCVETNVRSTSVPPLAEAAQAVPLSVQYTRGVQLCTAASCSSNDLISSDSQGSIEIQVPNAVSTFTSEHAFYRHEENPAASDFSEDHNLPSTSSHLSDRSENINLRLKHASNPLNTQTHSDFNPLSLCSRSASTACQNHSHLRHSYTTREEDILRHNSSLAPSEAASSAAVSPENRSSSIIRQHRTSLKVASKLQHNSLSEQCNSFSWANTHETNNSVSGLQEKPQRRSKLVFTDKPSSSQDSTCKSIESNPLCKNSAILRKIVRSDQNSSGVKFYEFSSRNAQNTHSRYNGENSRSTDSSLNSNSKQRVSDVRPRCTNPLLNNFEATSVGVHKQEYNFPHLRLTSSHRTSNQELNIPHVRNVDSPAIRTRRFGMFQGIERIPRLESESAQNQDASFRRTQRPGHRYSVLRHETAPRTQSNIHQSGAHVSFSLDQNQTLRIPRLTYRNHPWRPYEGLEFRHHLSAFNDRQIPRPVTDQTSQTLGAMNLPASNDQGTDVVGLDDTSANFVQAHSIIESPLDSLAQCVGFSDDTNQSCAFSKNSHDGTSIILSSLLDKDRIDGAGAHDSTSVLESERFQRIQNIVRSVRAYLTEEYGESFLPGGAYNRTPEPRSLVNSQGNTASGIGERHRSNRFEDRHLRSLHLSNNNSKPVMEKVTDSESWESLEQTTSNNATTPWSPDISMSSTLSASTSVCANNSPIVTTVCSFNDTSAFHGVSSHVNRISSVYAHDPVFSIPASSASRAIQLLSSTGSEIPESDRIHITNSASSNSSSLFVSDLNYNRSLLSGAGYENSARFHPYAYALRRNRNTFRHRHPASRDLLNNYSHDTATRESSMVSHISAGNFDTFDSRILNSAEQISPPAGVASRLRHLSDTDRPSAFSIFSSANREVGRHQSQFRTPGSHFNAASANSDAVSSIHHPQVGVQSHSSPQSSSQTLMAPNLGERENQQESSGVIGNAQQEGENNVTWRTPSLSLVNQVAVTEYLERRVIELDRRLSDLEQNYNSRLRELQVECQMRRSAHLAPGGRPARLRGVNIGPHYSTRDSMLFPRAQASSNDGTQSVPFRQLLECLRRQDPNPPSRVTEGDLPTSVTITQARDDESGDDTNGVGSSLRRRRPWHSLRQIHLHPDYSNSSMLDDTINHRNEHDGSNIGGPYSNLQYDLGIASNLVVQTHRIQQWDITKVTVPNLSDASANIVVRHCKLHNDASCNLSQDGTLLVTIVPSHRRFSDSNIVALFSLRRQSFAQCLYTKSFGPDALSVSISPLNRYVLVGLATRRTIFVTTAQRVGQVFQLVKEKAGESSMKHHKDIYHIYDEDRGNHVSVNSARWLPGVGEGLVYGTNRGDLHFFRAGARKVYDQGATCGREEFAARRRAMTRNSIGTQTTTVSIRRSASTQTLSDEQVREESMNTEH